MKVPTDWAHDALVTEEHHSGAEKSAFEQIMALDQRTTVSIECGMRGRLPGCTRGNRETRAENHAETGSSNLDPRGHLGSARGSRNFGCYGRSGVGPTHCRPRSQFPIEVGA